MLIFKPKFLYFYKHARNCEPESSLKTEGQKCNKAEQAKKQTNKQINK